MKKMIKKIYAKLKDFLEFVCAVWLFFKLCDGRRD